MHYALKLCTKSFLLLLLALLLLLLSYITLLLYIITSLLFMVINQNYISLILSLFSHIAMVLCLLE